MVKKKKSEEPALYAEVECRILQKDNKDLLRGMAVALMLRREVEQAMTRFEALVREKFPGLRLKVDRVGRIPGTAEGKPGATKLGEEPVAERVDAGAGKVERPS